MPDRIQLREIHTGTYPWARQLEINNEEKSLRVILDERRMDDDSVLRERFDATPPLTMADALRDPRIAEDAQIMHDAARRISLVIIEDYVKSKQPQKEEQTDDSRTK